MRSVIRRIAACINKIFRRTAACEQENKETAECKHEWEEIGRHSEATADFQAVFHYTDLQCKLCGKKGIMEQTDYQFH